MATTTIRNVERVGPHTIALTLETPPEFDAEPGQFVLIKATIDGVAESGYYTLSSPSVDDTFELTIEYDDEGTVGPWLAEHERGDTLTFEGPYGNVAYTGDHGVAVFASGPGIGPAVGIAERAREHGVAATIVYRTDAPAHETRLDSLVVNGATVHIATDATELSGHVAELPSTQTLYAFGFEQFIDDVRDAIEDAGGDPTAASLESFGPE